MTFAMAVTDAVSSHGSMVFILCADSCINIICAKAYLWDPYYLIAKKNEFVRDLFVAVIMSEKPAAEL